MAITDFHTKGYRSIKDLWLKMQPVNVIVGKNGTGKSNLYRAMYLISCAANGQLASALADEGGIKAALWAGKWGSADFPHSLSLSMRSGNFEYNLVCGRAGDVSRPSFFSDDPVIKKEEVYELTHRKRRLILDRRLGSIFVHAAGKKVEYTKAVADSESILAALHDPVSYPELFALREEIRGWRFYHHFRSDPDSPLRQPQVGVLTAALTHDGKDLAAALASIIESGDADWLESAIDEAFPGSTLSIVPTPAGLTINFMQPGLYRPFTGLELSDGTLQYLCLLAALLSLAPPPVMILNEPETSLHPSLIAPLSRLIAKASNITQIWLTTHSRELADAIMDATGYEPYELTKIKGETKIVGAGLGGYREKDDELS